MSLKVNRIDQFQIGFWHPFGPHAGESAEQIIERKRREILANDGWTLWSFQFRHTLDVWLKEIRTNKPQAVFVFCSEGKGASDPKGNISLCSSYRLAGEKTCQPIPAAIKVPHPIGKKTLASAFVVEHVEQIVYPVQSVDLPTVEWFKENSNPTWKSDTPVPTRPEYLIRSGGHLRMRSYRAILQLREPYLASVSTEERHNDLFQNDRISTV
jgi:hypothetical protein